MNSSQENRNMRSWTAGAALVLALGLGLPLSSWAEPRITSVTGTQQGGTDVVRVELSEALTAVSRGLRGAVATASGDRPARRHQFLRQVVHRGQPGQRALRERRQLGRSHASRAEPQDGVELPRRDPGQDPADLARHRRRTGCRGGARAGHRHALRQQPERRRPGSARHRLPPRHRRRWPRRGQLGQHAGGRRPEAAGQGPGGRLPAFQRAGAPAPPPRRVRLRHAGADDHHHPGGRSRAHGDLAHRRLGAQRLPDRQPVRAGSAARQERSEQARAGPGLHRPTPVAQLPEHRDPRAAADHCRLQRLQRRHQRYRHRYRHAAPEGTCPGTRRSTSSCRARDSTSAAPATCC